MSYEISVVIPVYNVEEYIGQCLDSVVNQSLGIENIEVIIVNDATPDNSMSIVNDYSRKFPSIKVINNKNNVGLGQSRNVGVSNTTSDFVTFIDSDDFISLNTFEDSLNKMKESDSDLLIYNGEMFTDDGHVEPPNIHNQKFNVNAVIENLNDFTGIFLLSSACNKIYHKKLFKYLNYPEGYYEDNEITARVLLNSDRIFLSCDSTYFYRKNSSSITKNIKLDNVLDLSKSVKALSDLLKEYSNYSQQIKLPVIKFTCDILFFLFHYDWSLNEELLIVDKLKKSVGNITVDDLNFFEETFPSFPISYREECLNLHKLSDDLFLAKYKYFNNLSKVKSQASIYVDDGGGFSEDTKISVEYVPRKNNKLIFDLSNFSDIDNLRFDPLEGDFIKSRINNCRVVDANCDNSINDEYQIFLNLDPIYILDVDFNSELIIDFDLEFLKKEDIAHLFVEKTSIINDLINKSNQKRFKFFGTVKFLVLLLVICA